MPKQATKTATESSTIILLVILALIVGYLLTMSKNSKPALTEPTSQIQKSDDLYQAQDEMNSVNIDGVDAGVNQLKTEVSTY